MKPKLILTRGLPASGKTTWANETKAHSTDIVIICKDDIRAEFPNMNERAVIKKRNELTQIVADNGLCHSVLWADTNLNPIHLATALDMFSDHFDIETKDFFDVPVEECIKRDLNRANPVGKDVIMEMYYRWVCPKESENTHSSLPVAIIIDIDGTIAVTTSRGHYDYSEGAVLTDAPRMNVINIIRAVIKSGVTPIFVSGRKDECKIDTRYWLSTYFGDVILLMREADDNRNDAIVKKEIYDSRIKDNYNVVGVFDDRPRVIRMWEKEGLTVFNVGKGYEF